jgi:phytoene/squalene synthetase
MLRRRLKKQSEIENNIGQFREAENFPVASFLLPASARNPILALYEFARNADEISDNKNEDAKLRNQRLQNLYNALNQGNIYKIPYYARGYYRACKDGKMNLSHGLALIQAFIQDTEKSRYNSWQETLDYCQLSAATIGRLVLEACNEFNAEIKFSDNICTVLQLINHLQDLKKDYSELDRIYFHNIPQQLISGDDESAELTSAKNEIIMQLKAMLQESYPIFSQLNSLRLRAEIATIYHVAQRLLVKLEKNNILANTRIELTKAEKIKCLISGSFIALKTIHLKINSSKKIAKHAKSSFVRPLIFLPKQKRKAMLCLYSFCRLVDDAVDDFVPSNENANFNPLDFWRAELNKIYSENNVDYPQNAVCRELSLYVTKYKIPKEFLLEIIEGQQMDFLNLMIKPSDDLLDKYCYRVASCVGLASIYIFGFNDANKAKVHNYAINLGKGLQYINIMRDVREDAVRGRIYLPLTLLQAYGLQQITAEELDKNFSNYESKISELLADMYLQANNYFKIAFENLPKSEANNMKIAMLMMRVYKKYLDKMKDSNFIFTRDEISLTLKEKLKLFSNIK